MCKTYVTRICRERGLKLVDATRPIVVGVAVDDILKARTANSKCCAFARAAKREPGVVAAYFFRSTAFLEYRDRMVRYHLPDSAQKEIVSFDRAGIMAPGEYQLVKPAPSRAPSVRRDAYKRGREVPLREGDPSKPQRPPRLIARAQGTVNQRTGRTARRTAFIRTTDEPR